MWKNNLKTAFRHFLKYKFASLINLAGLSIGISCCLLIVLYVYHECNYESWNPNQERIVRPVIDINFGKARLNMAVTDANVGPDSYRELPEVQAFCRIRAQGSITVRRPGDRQKSFKELNLYHADSAFFQLFPCPLLEGNARTALRDPNTIAISRTAAEKYFGSHQLAIGQPLLLGASTEPWKVSAVFEDIPSNTHFSTHLILAMNGNEEVQNAPPLWAANNNFHTYLLLQKWTNVENFRDKFLSYSREKLSYSIQEVMGMALEDFEATGQYARSNLQALKDIHLYSDLDFELTANGSIQYVWIFSAIALFVLLIACVNYMNMTTASSSTRAKEIGMRKVLGGMKSHLIGQFLSESILLTGIGFLLAFNLVNWTLPWFSELTGSQISWPDNLLTFGLCTLGAWLLIGLLAGSYPALFLTAIQPLRTIKGQLNQKTGRKGIRGSLVVFQFATSSILIIATTLVYHQLHYIQNKKLGFQKEQVLIVKDAYSLGNQVDVFKQELLQMPGVKSATVSSYLPVPSNRSNMVFSKSRNLNQDQAINMANWTVDVDYLKTLQLELAEGRFFENGRPNDSLAVVLNETAARKFGFDKAEGQEIYTLRGSMTGSTRPEDFMAYRLIGIVKDFHWNSLRDNIGAMSLFLGNSTGNISVRYDAADSRELLAGIESNWRKITPGQPFAYEFMDDAFQQMYDAEQRIGKIALLFTILAILVSCLGLFGLASFITEQRTKEIGIRKVLGASVLGIVAMLSKEFFRLLLIAFVVAVPLAWYGMDSWLENFAYRIDIEWWVFVIAALTIGLIAAISVGFQSVKAAIANPIDSLRNE
ncbi:MAG: ABC transporter permease [Bacteroidota bacterium]